MNGKAPRQDSIRRNAQRNHRIRSDPEFREKLRAYHAAYDASHRAARVAVNARYRNKPESKLKQKARKRAYMADPLFRARERLGHRLYKICSEQGMTKSASVMAFVGCSKADLMRWIESKFTRGMEWNNYGKWHIDHIIPCCKFDLTQPGQIALCFHFSNLRPMWARANMSKGGRLDMHRTLPLPIGA